MLYELTMNARVLIKFMRRLVKETGELYHGVIPFIVIQMLLLVSIVIFPGSYGGNQC